jgi:imidazolonepropionase-like amidohydrolase
MIKVIKCGMIIDGTGKAPVRNGVIVIEDETIGEVGAQGEATIPEGADVVDLRGQTVLPGFVDTMTHFGGRVDEPRTRSALFALYKMKADLKAGITSIRLLGEFDNEGIHMRAAIRDGIIAGPRIYSAGNGLKTHGGYGGHGLPFTGVDQVRRAIRENYAAGADCVKIYISGSSTSRFGMHYCEWTREELGAAIEEAHRLGMKIAAHATGGIGTTWFIEDGGDSVEHGSAMTEEQLYLAKEKGTYIVFTMNHYFEPEIVDWYKETLPEGLVPKYLDAISYLEREVIPKAIEKGVKYAVHTDDHHGGIPFGVEALVKKFGVSPMEAILAGTRNPAECIGFLDEVGTLEPGKYADLFSVRGNPLENIEDLYNVEMVMVGGKIYDETTGYWEGDDAELFCGRFIKVKRNANTENEETTLFRA